MVPPHALDAPHDFRISNEKFGIYASSMLDLQFPSSFYNLLRIQPAATDFDSFALLDFFIFAHCDF